MTHIHTRLSNVNGINLVDEELKIEDVIKEIFWNNFEKVQKEDYFAMYPDGRYKADLGKSFLKAPRFMKLVPYESIKSKALKSNQKT